MFLTPQPRLHVPKTSFAVRADAVFPATGTVMVEQTVMMVLMSPLPAVSTKHNHIHFNGRFIQVDILYIYASIFLLYDVYPAYVEKS